MNLNGVLFIAIDALGYSKEENTLKNVLEWALVNVKAQDLQYIFASGTPSAPIRSLIADLFV